MFDFNSIATGGFNSVTGDLFTGSSVGNAITLSKNLIGKGNDVKDTFENLKGVFNGIKSVDDFLEMDRTVIKQPWQVDNGIYNFFKTMSIDPSMDTINVGSYPLVFFVKPPIRIFSENYGADLNPASTDYYNAFIAENFSYLNNKVYNDLAFTNWFKSFTIYNRSIDMPNQTMNIEPSLTNRQKESFMIPSFFSGHNGSTINASFIDDKYLTNLRIVKSWFDYIKYMTEGELAPSRTNLLNNIVDYKSSIYMIGLEPNFKDIQWYAKYTGVIPTNVPISSIGPDRESMSLRSFNVEFSYDYFEFLDYRTLVDFNILGEELGIRVLDLADGNKRIEVL